MIPYSKKKPKKPVSNKSITILFDNHYFMQVSLTNEFEFKLQFELETNEKQLFKIETV